MFAPLAGAGFGRFRGAPRRSGGASFVLLGEEAVEPVVFGQLLAGLVKQLPVFHRQLRRPAKRGRIPLR